MIRRLMSLKSSEITNYAAVFGLIAVSGMPYFYTAQINLAILMAFVLFVYLKRSIKFDTRMLGIVFVFFVIELLQVLIIKPFVPETLIGTYLRLFLGFFIISLCGKKFTSYYVNVIYFLAIVSFIFYFPSIAVPGFHQFFENSICPLFPAPFAKVDEFYHLSPTIVIYTFHETITEFRNAGAFWEPGAFAIFVLIAFIFNIINTHKLWSRKNIVFSIAVITTLSTSGFIAFFILVIGFYFATGDMIKIAFAFLTILPLTVILYFNLEFLNTKIVKNMDSKDDNSSRFGSATSDLRDFSTSPIIGWGRGAMRYGGKKFTFFTADQHRNNGLTGLLASYGIIIFCMLLYNYYKTLKVLCVENDFHKHFAIFAFIVILLLGFSQTIFQYPFFYSIMFIHYIYTDKNALLPITNKA